VKFHQKNLTLNEIEKLKHIESTTTGVVAKRKPSTNLSPPNPPRTRAILAEQIREELTVNQDQTKSISSLHESHQLQEINNFESILRSIF